MCEFFSFIQNKDGDFAYLGKDERDLPRVREHPDSHSVIADYFGWDVDKVNKYEVDITGGGVLNDEIVHYGIVKDAHAFAKALDYRKVHKAIKVKTPWKVAKELKLPYYSGKLTRRDRAVMKELDWAKDRTPVHLPSNGTRNDRTLYLPKFCWASTSSVGDLVLSATLIYSVGRLPKWVRQVEYLISKGVIWTPYYSGEAGFQGRSRNGRVVDLNY